VKNFSRSVNGKVKSGYFVSIVNSTVWREFGVLSERIPTGMDDPAGALI